MSTIFYKYCQHVFRQIESNLQGITEDELSWRPSPSANNLEWILRHMARISCILLPQVVNGTTSSRWNDDYEKREHNLEQMLLDFSNGGKRVLEGISRLREDDWEELIPLWDGMHAKKEGIFMLMGELIHHNGQIAYIKGAYKRNKLGKVFNQI